MSHPDPYGSTEPRGWDRPDRPAALPWPEPEVEPGPWTRHPSAGPELYAEPRTQPRPSADPYGDRGGPYPPDPYDDRGGHYPPDSYDDGRRYPANPYPYRGGPEQHGDPRRPGPYPDRGRPRDDRHPDERHDGHPDERYDRRPDDRRPDERYDRERYDRDPDERYDRYADDPRHDRYDGPVGAGPVRYDDDSGYPTAQLEPVRVDLTQDTVTEAERPPGRRQPGRRRASIDRPATQQPTGRAGRNLPAAIGVGLGLGALILVPLFFFRPAFLAVIIAAVCVGVWEMARAVRRSGAHPPLVPLVAGGALTVGLAWYAGPDALSLGLLVTVLGTMIWRLGDGPGGYQRDLTASTLIAVYVPFLGGFAALLAAAPDDGEWRILATLVAVVLSDTGGYAAGVAFGKHPMAPSVSPKKSWEGFAGSVTAAALGSAVLIWQMFDVAPWWGALFGVVVSGAAVLGDLGESMIKRDLGVKDMSNLLPGHGGLMDRLDSVLFAVPAAYLLLAVVVPVAG
ncbi:phosphatidate cytidylyltransferase [Micromonospora sp. WMMD812]|uniref:phosphatidate cytidylyltransferase n=1 Tax=Micromonospora sp. WMMD812 TaxID=3015152 RepID=UPI00248AC079|nr:phosphatidate cytidylyltransferase [Micromonospora sp. WMMD812]WBB70416.1 phosphatidate cytidylyltransferase [Micromonospora sp. WMMD812]